MFLYSLVVPVLPFALTQRADIEEKDVQKWTSVFLSIYGAALAVASRMFFLPFFLSSFLPKSQPFLIYHSNFWLFCG